MFSLSATASRTPSIGSVGISSSSSSNDRKKFAGLRLKTGPGAFTFATKQKYRKRTPKGTWCDADSDSGPRLDDVLTEVRKLTENMGKLSENMGRGLDTLDKRVGEAVSSLSAKVEAEVKSVRDVLKSLDDHAGRTAEARLRERATQEMWRADSGKAAQRSFQTVEEIIEHVIAAPKGANKQQLLHAYRNKVVEGMEAEGAIESAINDLLLEVRDRFGKEEVPSAYTVGSETPLAQLCNAAGRSIGDMATRDLNCPEWMRAALQSFALLGRQLHMKEAVLLDWEKGPGMTILVHSAIKSEREDAEAAVENLRARVEEEKADARDGGREGDENENQDGGGGRMEWRRALEVDMVGGLEERADGLVLEVGEAKRTSTQISKGRLQLYLFKRVVGKILMWATGRNIARAKGYIYVEAYGADWAERFDGMDFEVRYRV